MLSAPKAVNQNRRRPNQQYLSHQLHLNHQLQVRVTVSGPPETAEEFDEQRTMGNYASEWAESLSRDNLLSLSILLRHVYSLTTEAVELSYWKQTEGNGE